MYTGLVVHALRQNIKAKVPGFYYLQPSGREGIYDPDLNFRSRLHSYVVKYDSTTGDLLWINTFGSDNAADFVADVAVDGQGNVIAGGSFQNTVNFGDGDVDSNGIEDAYVVKYKP